MLREYDRAAPNGTGTIKVGGNYAASLVAGEIAHSKGYAAVLYLDPKEKKYLDECGPANFFGIRGNSYITPQSHSILPSITNKSLQQLAEDMGLTVERRPVPFEEIATFDEAAECGTAAVIAPISQIDDLDENKSFVIAKDGKPVLFARNYIISYVPSSMVTSRILTDGSRSLNNIFCFVRTGVRSVFTRQNTLIGNC